MGRKTKGLAKVLAFTTALSLGSDALSERRVAGTSENRIGSVQLLIDDAEFQREFEEDLVKHPEYILRDRSWISLLRDPEYVYQIAAQCNSAEAVMNAKQYASLPNAKMIFQNAAENLLNSDNLPNLYVRQELIRNYDLYKDFPFADKILEKFTRGICEEHPDIIFKIARHLSGKEYEQEILEKAFKADPYSAIEHGNHCDGEIGKYWYYYSEKEDQQRAYAASMKEITAALEKSNDPVVRSIGDLNKTEYPVETKKKMSLLMQNFLDKKMSFSEMAQITKDDSKMLLALMDVGTHPDPIGKKSIQRELKDKCLEKVYQINMLHNEADALRFKLVEGMGPRELYALMVYGEDEVYTSSFNGLFDRMARDMEEKNIPGDQLIETAKYVKFRTFIKMCAGFNRLNDFLATMKPESAENLLKRFVRNIESAPDMLSQAVGVADTFGSLKDPAILEIMQKEIVSEYQRVQETKNTKGEALYGLLAGLFKGKIVIDDNWLREIAQKYKLPSLEKVSSSELFNPDETNVQQYFFYNDADGKGSFENFISQYKNKADWKIEQKGDYVLIGSVAGKNKKKIEIYANLPDKEKEGTANIEKELKKRNIQSIVVVHRGHSYHVQKTIERIPNIAKIVSLGSCGGYNNLRAVLKRAPGAHIISTKGRGTVSVNDPLFKMLNVEILGGRDIRWNEFWTEAEKKLGNNKDFSSYVPPHKNLGVLFIKAYNEIIKDKK